MSESSYRIGTPFMYMYLICMFSRWELSDVIRIIDFVTLILWHQVIQLLGHVMSQICCCLLFWFLTLWINIFCYLIVSRTSYTQVRSCIIQYRKIIQRLFALLSMSPTTVPSRKLLMLSFLYFISSAVSWMLMNISMDDNLTRILGSYIKPFSVSIIGLGLAKTKVLGWEDIIFTKAV